MKIVLIYWVICVLYAVDHIECIYGGQDATEGKFPYHALIRARSGSGYDCSGVILKPRFILTTVGCGKLKDSIVIGSLYRTGGIEIDIDEIINHPLFSPSSNTKTDSMSSYDLALLRIAKDIKFTKSIQPAGLPTSDLPLNGGKNVYVSGWGPTFDKTYPDTFQFAKTMTMSSNLCKSWLQNVVPFPITDKHVCTSNEAGTGACDRGDLGAPLVDESKIVIGVLSWVPVQLGDKCGKGRPDFYMKIYPFTGWIKSVMNPNEKHENFAAVSHNRKIILTLIILEMYLIIMNMNVI